METNQSLGDEDINFKVSEGQLSNPESPDQQEARRQERLQSLKALRQVFAIYGFSEIKGPEYAEEGNKSSDIILIADTKNFGEYAARININNEIIIDVGSGYDPATSRRIDITNELIAIREQLLQQAEPGAKVIIEAGGQEVVLPAEKIAKKEEPAQSNPPKPMDPSKENYSYDPDSGRWFVSPK